jgi:hypothetical protein
MVATLLSCVLILGVSGVAQTPKEPDFSGEWVLVEATGGAASDPAAALVVRQRVTRTTSRGEPMTPYFSHLAIERHFKNRIESESYQIGIVSGTVSGLGQRTTETVTWQGERLAIKRLDAVVAIHIERAEPSAVGPSAQLSRDEELALAR